MISFGRFSGRVISTLTNINILTATCDFQQCGILASVDLDEPAQFSFNLETSNDVQSVA